jgi:hypothetical protein
MYSTRSWKNAARAIIIKANMKKNVFLLLAGWLVLSSACNNTGGDPGSHVPARTKADTLQDEVNEGHNIGMGKMGRLTRAQQEVTRLLDSVSKLPAKTQQAAAPYKARLESLLQDLNYADFAMNKWMNEFKWDSTFADVKSKIRYLEPEKEKVTRVKEAILHSLQKADSVLDRKF